jgi:hypothetical protein
VGVLPLKYTSAIAWFILNKKLFPHDVSRAVLPSLDPLNPPVSEKKPCFLSKKFSLK